LKIELSDRPMNVGERVKTPCGRPVGFGKIAASTDPSTGPIAMIDLPTDRVVRVGGPTSVATALSIEPMPAEGPAVLKYSFPIHSTGSRTDAVVAILRDLEDVAIELYPAWLPGAEGIDSLSGTGAAALRATVFRLASQTSHFGPFLLDLALRAMRPGRTDATAFTAEIRAAGLARVMAASFGRSRAVLLVSVPEGLGPSRERVLVAACDWLADRDRFGVWLTGAPLTTVDWVESVAPPSAVARGNPPRGHQRPVHYPPVAGRPHPGSQIEQRMERALRTRSWAVGRVWNQVMRLGALINPVQPDLLWPDERCVVELDGEDHHDAYKFAQDRARDVELQLAGYAVLRFTNQHVLDDIESVLVKIEHFLIIRRSQSTEGHPSWRMTS
jgi:very-short-patch-repair endonuclease